MFFSSVKCKDGSSCPSETTCCILASGSYGCCPTPNAVCCKDKIHCCPSGYICDLNSGRCQVKDGLLSLLDEKPANDQIEDGSLPLLVKKPANYDVFSSVKCKDGSSCPSETTCCILASGSYGCCPTPNAVCCKDKIHCCPSGYICDLNSGRCQVKDGLLPLLDKKPANYDVFSSVKCKDGSSCPSETTCCIL